MTARLVYRVVYKSTPVYDIYADGSIKNLRSGEVYEAPTSDRMDEIYRDYRAVKGRSINDLKCSRSMENPPFKNELERRELRRRLLDCGANVPSGVSFAQPSEEDALAFHTLKVLGCAPREKRPRGESAFTTYLYDGVDFDEPYYDEEDKTYDEGRKNIEVRYFGKAEKPWKVVDYDKMIKDGVRF